jgi:hypothetical protein
MFFQLVMGKAGVKPRLFLIVNNEIVTLWHTVCFKTEKHNLCY